MGRWKFSESELKFLQQYTIIEQELLRKMRYEFKNWKNWNCTIQIFIKT